jgi:hypothetical protein
VKYEGGFDASSETIQHFWRLVSATSQERKEQKQKALDVEVALGSFDMTFLKLKSIEWINAFHLGVSTELLKESAGIENDDENTDNNNDNDSNNVDDDNDNDDDVNPLSVDERRKLLAFITGSDRLPIDGLAAMQLVLQKNGSHDDANAMKRLPSAGIVVEFFVFNNCDVILNTTLMFYLATCFNTLLLPDYQNEKLLKNKLIVCVQNSEGFGLN